MKRISIITAIMIVVSILTGCGADPTAVNQQQQGDIGRDSIATLSVTPLSADVTYQLSSTIEQIETASSQWESLDYVALAEAYVNGAEENDEFATFYRNSESVEVYPVFGTYLEPTGSAIYMFYQKEEPYAVAKLLFDSTGNVAETPVCKDMTDPPKVVSTMSAEACYCSIKQCRERNPEFEIMGLVLDTEGFQTVFPIGKQKGEKTIKYMAGEAKNFNLVDPFETIEAGYNAFSEHLAERKRILSEITIYPWTKHPFYDTGYIREFASISMSSENPPAYIEKYDSLVAVPLLSSDLEENVYILHLLYYHNQLIAEVVIESKYEAGRSVCSAVWENVSSKDETGEYIPMETSQYVKVLNGAAAYRATWEGQGVVYDSGKIIPIGVCEGKLMAFDCITNAVDVYK